MTRLIAFWILFCSSISYGQTSTNGLIDHFRLDYSGYISWPGGTEPTWWMDFSQDPHDGYTDTSNDGTTATIGGNPQQLSEGSYPQGQDFWKWYFNGGNEYIQATLPEPSGDFTAMVVWTPANIGAGFRNLISHYQDTNGQRSWVFYQQTDGYRFIISKDGSATEAFAQGGILEPGKRNIAFVTYDFITDGTSLGTLYAQNLVDISKNNFSGPVYTGGTPKLGIGADSAGQFDATGDMHFAAFWDHTGDGTTLYTGAQIRSMIENFKRSGPTGIQDQLDEATTWVDFSQDPADATFTDNGGDVTFTRTGTPDKTQDFTQTSCGWEMDGNNDRVYSAVSEPTADFSAIVLWEPENTNTGNRAIISQYEDVLNERSWVLYQSQGTGLRMQISKDGSAVQGFTQTGLLKAKTPHCIAITYDYVGDGTSVGTIYVDEETEVIKPDFVGPVYTGGTPDLSVGADSLAQFDAPGTVYYAAFFDHAAMGTTVLTEDEIRNICRQYRGLFSTNKRRITISGTDLPAVMWATPDSGVEPFFKDMPDNSYQIGPYGMPISNGGTNTTERASFETCTQNGNTEPDGWTVTEGGSGDASCVSTSRAHGENAVELDTGAADSAKIESACVTCTASTCNYDLPVSVFAKKTDGTATLDINIEQFSDGSCSTSISTLAIKTNDALSFEWDEYTGEIASGTWDATASSYEIEIVQDTTDGTVVVDAITVGTDTKGCFCDTDAACVCNAVISSFLNPFIDNFHGRIKSTVRTEWDGSDETSDAHILTTGDPTAANEWSMYIDGGANDDGSCLFVDSAGDDKIVEGTGTWSANTDYEVVCNKTDQGAITGDVDGTEMDSTGGTGNGLQTSQQTDIYFGTSSTNTDRIWVQGLQFYRRIKAY